MLTETQMHFGSLLLVVWLVIGGVAAGQRGDFKEHIDNCSTASTIAVTILAGPLNYAGVNPNIECTTPQPSN
jgi:NhaP-type Na+/H+ and K+/H+ antiporter